MKTARALLLLSSCVLVASCFSPSPLGPPRGYERDEVACVDGDDNDFDRLIDCRDPDCLMGGFCAERTSLDPDPHPEDT